MPTIPESATEATGIVPPGLSGPLRPYSVVIPGITKASVVGFMMSIVTAIAIVTSRPMCARVIGVASSASTRICDACRSLAGEASG